MADIKTGEYWESRISEFTQIVKILGNHDSHPRLFEVEIIQTDYLKNIKCPHYCFQYLLPEDSYKLHGYDTPLYKALNG